MKIIDITLIIAGAYFISGVGCSHETTPGQDVIDAFGSDSSEIDVAPVDTRVDAVDGGEIDAEALGSKSLCEICTDDSECIDGTVCVSIEISFVKECHTACSADEDCNGSECVIDDGRGYCDPDEPCYPRCYEDKPFLDIDTKTCVECLEDSSCYYEDQYCSENRTCTCIEKTCDVGMRQCSDCQCGACCENCDCDSTEVCWEHSCVDREVPCENECIDWGMMCYTGESEPFCIDCQTDSDCSEDCTCSGYPLWACEDVNGELCRYKGM